MTYVKLGQSNQALWRGTGLVDELSEHTSWVVVHIGEHISQKGGNNLG